MTKSTVQSIEPNIAELANGWLKEYGLDYKLEQEKLNNEIDRALNDYYSKSGGNGSNRPDTKLLLQDKHLNYFPVLIEYKGYKNKLIKLDEDGHVQNTKNDNTPNYTNIKGYAVNGAVHYANALLHYTEYSDVISIGMTGYKDITGKIKYEIGVYFVSKSNLGIGQKVGEFTDFSFLKKEYFDKFIDKVRKLSLNQKELQKIKLQREQEIDASLVKLNNDIYKNEKGLSEKDRVNLVAASIMATIGIADKVPPLEKTDLKSSSEKHNTDGEIIIRKISNFLDEKHLPYEKKQLIINSLSNTIINGNVNKIINGETQLKRVFTKVIDDLGFYYKIGLTTDFTGKLFNEMYSWLGFTQDKLNDVVLTPSYVTNLLVKLARVNKDSYVWDFATGSAGLLVAAMNEMLDDAKQTIKSPEKLIQKEIEIKANQLLGLEILPEIYMLAILNMILMGDGSSNILNEDSLLDFDGNYGFGKDNEKFPATAFVLNPPYSAEGNGMIFVERALNMMASGYGAIIIQDSAGNGKATEYNQRILKDHTLVASIKMPDDLFIGKSNVKTYIYIFKVKERHEKEFPVKFIDFSYDGYARAARGKSSTNLRDINNAKKRYEELVKVVKFGPSQLNYISKECYIEDKIDIPEEGIENDSGKDWNFGQHIRILGSTTETIVDKVVANKIVYQLRDFLISDIPSTTNSPDTDWSEFKIGDLFTIEKTKGINKDALTLGLDYDYVTRTSENEGVLAKTGLVEGAKLNSGQIWSLGLLQMDFFYRDREWYSGQFVRKIVPKFDIENEIAIYFTAILNSLKPILLSWLVRDVDRIFLSLKVKLPININGEIDFEYIKKYVNILQKNRISQISSFINLQMNKLDGKNFDV